MIATLLALSFFQIPLLPGLEAGVTWPPLLGPPAICHPIDIGDAKSLPWGKHPFDVNKDYDLDHLVKDTYKILEESSDTLVHMETLRRATIYLEGMGSGKVSRKKSEELSQNLEHTLRKRLQHTIAFFENKERTKQQLGYAYFDLGYFLGALNQVRDKEHGMGAKELDKAAKLMENDGAAYLGAALASWNLRDHNNPPYGYLSKSIALVQDDDELLQKNLTETAGSFLGVDTYAELVAKVKTKVKRT